jgi:sugar phosphate isomerase/epimerase/GNAT superfamily N-acetyltransferase
MTHMPILHRLSGRDGVAQLRTFLDEAGRIDETFRYFTKRPLDVIGGHLCTWLLVEDGRAVAYGHLERDGGVVWLGIAVQERAQGRGYGRAMMTVLLDAARACGVGRVRLSVDNRNVRAIRLYERTGFTKAAAGDGITFFERDLTPPARVVVSSVAFGDMPVASMIDAAKREQFALEFSSGLPHDPDAVRTFREAGVARFAHGYFPAPAEPFVVNLASPDADSRRRSIEHCVQGLELSHAAGAPFFSAHAGFCADVDPGQLGGRELPESGDGREHAWARFVEAIREVLARTFHLPVGLVVENHVVVPVNRRADGSHALLCADPDEAVRLIEDVRDPRLGLLCDTAHWKVTASTLGFDRAEAVERTLPYMRCVHHSDNDGVVDDNRPFDERYWFLPFRARARHAVHVLETRAAIADLHRMNALLFGPGPVRSS